MSAITVRELPPLRQHLQITTPTGRTYRWAEDEPDPSNVPSALRHSSTMPGGFETLDCTLPRRPGIDYQDLERLSTIRAVGAGGDISWEGRLEQAPLTSGDQMAVSPSAVGWQAALEDDKSAREIYVDLDFGRWQEALTERRLALANGSIPQGKIPVTIGPGAVVWDVPAEPLNALETTEVQYDAGPGIKVSRVEYRGGRIGASWAASFEPTRIFTDNAPEMSAASSETLVLDSTNRVATTFADGRYVMLRARASAAVTPAAGHQQRLQRLAVYGDHGVGLVSAAGTISGILASEVVTNAIYRWAPTLRAVPGTTVQPSTFTIPHLVFPEMTTAAEIIRQATRFGLQDWAVWNDRTFWWHARGAHGRNWRARTGPAQLEETGTQTSRLYESIVVQYSDVDGGTRTIGPPGSRANTETALLKDSDPENPANRLGIIRRDLLTMGTSTAAAATEVGRRFLEEQKLLDTSGRARLVGHVTDENGVLHPYWRVRAGDTITFTDAANPSPRRIIRADSDRQSRSVSIDLDSPPDGMTALLERLSVVLVPLGVS